MLKTRSLTAVAVLAFGVAPALAQSQRPAPQPRGTSQAPGATPAVSCATAVLAVTLVDCVLVTFRAGEVVVIVILELPRL